MALADQLGAVDPQGVVTGLIAEQAPDLVQNGAVDPQTVLNRLIRKGLDQRQQRDLQQRQNQPPAPADLSSFGKTKEEVAQEPAVDFSAFGEEAGPQAPAQPTPKKDEWGGYISTAGRAAARDAVEHTGRMIKGAGLAAEAFGSRQATAADMPPTPELWGRPATEADMPPSPPPVARPVKENPLYRAGQAVQDFGEHNIPLTPTEEKSITGRAARMVGGFVPLAAGMVAGGAVAGPAGALAVGSLGMAASSGAAAYDDAIAKGADEATAAKAAGLNALVGGGLGLLPLGVILAPVRASAPGLMGWAATKLEQAVRSGVTFAAVGEVQEYLAQQIAKNFYDPKAGYAPEVERIIASLIAGGVIGAVSPAHNRNAAPAAAASAPGAAGAAGPAAGLPPPGTGPASAAGTAGPGAGPRPGSPGVGPEAPKPFESKLRPTLRASLEANAAYYKEHSREDIRSWSDEQLKAYVNNKFGFGSAKGEEANPEQAKPQAAAEDTPAAPAAEGTRERAVDLKTAEDVARATAVADQDHSHAQGEANNVQRAHAVWNGLEITIEAPPGGVRRGMAPDGTPFETSHPHAYGYFKGLPAGADGQHPDVVVGDHPGAPTAYVIDEVDKATGKFRQTKSFVGFQTWQAAAESYLGISTKDRAQIGGMRAFPVQEFVEIANAGGLSEPVSEAMTARAEAVKTAAEAPRKGPEASSPAKEAASNTPKDPSSAQESPQDVTAEHHAAVEAAVRGAGADPAHVRPADLARAAEIHAHEGLPPEQAFPVAVARGLIEDGHISKATAEKVLGHEAANELLSSGQAGVERGVPAAAPGAAARGPAAAPAQGLADGGAQHGAEIPAVAEKPAGGESRGRAGQAAGAGDSAAGRSAADHAAGGERPAEADVGRAGEQGQPARERVAAQSRPAEGAETAVAHRDPPDGFEVRERSDFSRGRTKWEVHDADGHRLPRWFKDRDDAIAGAERAAEAQRATERDDLRDDLHTALTEAKIPFDTVLPEVEDRAVLIMAEHDVHPLDALEAALLQIERENNDVPEQALLALGIPKDALDAIDQLQPSRDRQTPAPAGGETAESGGREIAQEREPAPRTGAGAGEQPGARAEPEQPAERGAAAEPGRVEAGERGAENAVEPGGGDRSGVAKPKPGWTEIGKNDAGRTLFEDARGVRSYVENGVRLSEPVPLRPSRAGVEMAAPEHRDEWLTAAESALKPAPEAPNIKAEESPDGIPPSVHAGDARTGAADVQGPVPDRGTGPVRGAQGAPGEPTVPGSDEGRPEGTGRLPEATLRPGGGGAGEVAAHPVPERGEPAAGRGERAAQPPAADAGLVGENYRIEPGALEETRSWKRKAEDNVAALTLARRLESEGRPASRAEQHVLAKYVGWGGIKGAFPDADGNFGKGLEKIGATLKDILPADEYKTAQRSIQYAHYTAETVVRAMWEAVDRLGLKGGSAFEPGMGIGNFAGLMPPDAHFHYAGLEFDATTARIAKLLYPKFGVRHADFTRAPLPENSFDLVIGNPPFADVVVKSDPKYAKQNLFLHDYFFAKSLDAVRPGGVLAFISSAGTMNKINATAREYLADRAELAGAIRLPSDAFKQNAGTEVTTDIIFLRKRFPGEPAGDRTWTETVAVSLPGKGGKTVTGAVNRYFAEHPEMVLGEQGFFDKLYEDRYAVHARPGQDLAKDLTAAIARLPADVVRAPHNLAEFQPLDWSTTEKKEGTFYLGPNGELHQVRGGAGLPLARRGAGTEGGYTAAATERIKGLIPIRDALREVYAANLADDGAAGDAARKRLNAAYDGFVETFGPINKADIQHRRPTSIQAEGARAEAREEARYAGEAFHEGSFDPGKLIAKGAGLAEVARARKAAREEALAAGKPWDEGSFNPEEMPDVIIDRRPNVDPFMDDPESYRLRAVEHYDDATFQAKKSAAFFENTISRAKPPEIKSTNDALLYTLNQRGRVDVPEIARLAGKTPSEVIDDLGEAIFREPGSRDSYLTREDYLSGNVLDKLGVAKAEAERDPSFKRNVEALEAVQPTPLAPSQITATLGMPWLPPETIVQFGRDELGLEKLKVDYIPALASWVTEGDRQSAAATTLWGTDRRRGPDLLEDVLNRRQIKIYDQVTDADGKKHSVLNVEATQAAQDKAQAIRDKFDGWIWSDGERADALSGLYNSQYNNLVVRQYDGSYLTTPGVATSWSWRPHQKRAIARIIQSGNTYVAHAVGAGKTSEYIGAVMEMRRLGLVRKPMIAVPNHMLGQFTKEFYEQYPTANIAVADERRFHTDRRKQFVANVANDDLDAIIITHSAFGMIPVSHGFADDVVQAEIDHYREVLEQIPKDQEHRITRSRVEKQIERMEQRLTGRGNARKDQVFTFEEMGVDFLVVDEAHLFRKLDFSTQMGSVKGISPEGSQMSWDLYVKSLYLDSINPGRSLVLGWGTPVTNTMAELFTVSRYLQRAELAKRGLSQFDAWASAFGEPVTELEQDAAGGYKAQTRFSRFVNVAELSAMVRQTMDVVTSKQLEQYVVRPKLKGGKRTMRLAEKSPALERYQQSLAERMRAIERRRGPPQKGDDIMLTVINDGRHAAIDMRLVGAKADKNSKLTMLVNDVYETWKATKRAKFYGVKDGAYDLSKPIDVGPATQMIFANLGLSGKRGFSVPDFIRAELVRRGVPKNEIAYIYDYKTHVQKQRLFNDMNEGKVRVLIGSTAKMATGVNAQRRLIAINNLDPLWYPSDDEQRNGRGIRQGNQNPEIEIRDYGTKGTYDSTMWGMMERKARFIQGFFEGDPSLRNMDDLGEASQYEQAKAISTNDPRLIKLTELKQSLERANRRWAAFDQELHAVKRRRADARSQIKHAESRIESLGADIAQRVDTTGDKFEGKVGKTNYAKRVDFGEALLGALDKIATKDNFRKHFQIAEVGGFALFASPKPGAEKNDVWIDVYLKLNGDAQRGVSAGTSGLGAVRSIETILHGLEADREEYKQQAAKATRFLAESEDASKATFTGQAEIDDLARQVRVLQAQLAADSAKVVKPADVDPAELSSLDALTHFGWTNEAEPVEQWSGLAAAMAMPAKPAWYYSAVGRAIDGFKQQKAAPNQWLGMLRNSPGVKAEELQWLGLDGWLRDHKGPVTRDALADYVRANSIEVQEVEKRTGPQPQTEQIEALLDWVRSEHPADVEDARQAIIDIKNGATGRVGDLEGLGAPDDLLEPFRAFARGEDGPKFGHKVLPGGENYRELLLKLPERDTITTTKVKVPTGWGDTAGGNVGVERQGDTGADFRGSHWEEPNVLAHVRFNDRTIDGKKTLFIEEVQSDWHQKGKKLGYGQSADSASLDRAIAATRQIERDHDIVGIPGTAVYEDELRQLPEDVRQQYGMLIADINRLARSATDNRVPDAPFKTTWVDLSLKRMIRYAAENGYEQIAWTPGEVQADRYDLSKRVKSVTYSTEAVDRKLDGPGRLRAFDHNNNAILSQEVKPEALADHVGKDVAERLLAAAPNEDGYRQLSGLELKVGGEGMVSFYDKELPNKVNALVKKFGGHVGQSVLQSHVDSTYFDGPTPTLGQIDQVYEAVTARPTDQRWESPITGQRQSFQINRVSNQQAMTAVLKPMEGEGFTFGQAMAANGNADLAEIFGGEIKQRQLPRSHRVHTLPITPQLRDAALSQGFPLFQAHPAQTQEAPAFQPSKGLSEEAERKRLEMVAARRRLLTPAAELRKAELAGYLRDLIHRMVGDAVEVRFRDTIDSSGTVGWGQNVASTAGGKFLPLDDVILLALSDPRFGDKASVAFHEAYHAVEDHFINDREMALLKREEPRLRQIAARKMGVSEETAKGFSDYEVRAIAFQAYADERARGGNGAGMHIGIRGLFERLLRLLKQIANYLRGLGFHTAEDVFAKIYQGEMRDRPSRKLDEGRPSRLAEGILAERAKAARDGTAIEAAMAAPGRRPTSGIGRYPMPETIAGLLELRNHPKLAGISSAIGIGKANAIELRVKLQDKFLRWKRIEEAAVREGGAPLPESMQTYLAESLYYGRTGERLEKLDKDRIDPLIEDIKRRGLSLQEVDEFLMARHAPERNARLRAINPAIADPSGMSDAAARDILNRIYHGPKRGDYGAIEKQVRALIDETRDTLVKAGLISKDTAQAWKDAYKHYVPLRGWAEAVDADTTFGVGRGFDIRGAESKAALGRSSIADSPLGYVLMQAQQAIVRAEKNKVGQTALRFLRAHPNPEVWSVGKGPSKRVIDPESGLVKDVGDPLWTQKDTTFSAKEDGAPVYVDFRGPYGAGLARALNSLGTANMGGVMRFLGSLTRILARLSTSWNPDFMIPNFVRDAGEAFINMQENKQRDFVKRFSRHLLPAIGGSFNALRGGKGGTYSQAFRDFDEAGGRIRFFGMENVEDVKANIEKKMRRLEGGVMNSVAVAGGKALTAIEIANGAIENATRLAAFMAARDVGLSSDKAASIARELTVNFNRKGELGTAISSLYMFANAALQGQARMLSAMAASSRARRFAYALAAAAAALTLYNIGAGGDDADGVPYYMKIAPWERDTNMILMWPKGFGHDGQYVKLPLPYGYAFFAVIGSHATSLALGKEKASKAWPAMAKSVLDAFDPLGRDENMLAQFAPTVARPVIHLYTNTNWTGRPISPTSEPWNRHQPDSQRSFRSHSEFGKAAAAKLNEVTGGTKREPGLVDIAPGTIDYLLGFVTGGLGRFVNNTASTAWRGYEGQEWQINKTPIVHRFVGEKNDAGDRALYFEAREEVRNAYERAKSYRKDKDQANLAQYNAAHRAEIGAHSKFDSVDQQRKAIQGQIDRIKMMKDLSAAEKDARIRPLELRELGLMAEARKQLERARSAKPAPAAPAAP